ncbi:MAG: threonine synthase [Erysipelotrichia bacterium]|nr:threonine synthase [Erysipelotrichia bacterium]
MNLFLSTRNKENVVYSKEAIIQGLAKDGGLYMPTELIDIKIDLNKCLDLNYQQLATYILSNIFDDFTKEEIRECVFAAYTNSFKTDNITPVTKIGKDFLLELYHGPTSAFKDVALTILPHLLNIAYKSYGKNKKIYILTATSGDTGKATLEAFKDVKNTYVTVFYPKDKVSEIQEKQMNTTKGNNVDVVSVVGNFDDCQRLVKTIYEDNQIHEIYKNVQLSSANSINVGRLIPQVVYYFKAYSDLVNNGFIKLKDKVNFIVPTGNFGDILAGYIAKLIGCPINKLVCASNKNNVLVDFINTGIYDINRKFYTTISPSMDILISSNLERLLFVLSDFNDQKIKQYMNDLKTKGRYKIDKEMLNKLQQSFVGIYVSENECKKAMHQAFFQDKRLIDPHTAIGYHSSNKYRDNYKNIILATASPFKFPTSVLSSITDTIVEDEVSAMEKLAQISKEEIPTNLKGLDKLEILHNKTIKINEGRDYVIERIKELND